MLNVKYTYCARLIDHLGPTQRFVKGRGSRNVSLEDDKTYDEVKDHICFKSHRVMLTTENEKLLKKMVVTEGEEGKKFVPIDLTMEDKFLPSGEKPEPYDFETLTKLDPDMKHLRIIEATYYEAL